MATAEWMRDYRRQVRDGERVVPPPKELPPPVVLTDDQVTDLELRWREEYRKAIAGWLIRQRSPHTRRAYQRAWRQWLAWCADHDIDGINPPEGTGGVWQADLIGRGYKPASVHQYMVAIRQALIELTVCGLRNGPEPFVRVKEHPIPDTSSVLPLSDEEVGRVIASCREAGDWQGLTAVLLCAVCGLRANEAGQVTAHTVQRSQWGWVASIRGKGGKRALVPLPDVVMDAFRQAGCWPMDGRRANPYVRIRYLVEQAGDRAGVRVRCHQLRHWHVTTALREGVPLERVQDSVRHADPKTTQRYNRARVVVEGHSAFTLAGLPAVTTGG